MEKVATGHSQVISDRNKKEKRRAWESDKKRLRGNLRMIKVKVPSK